MTGDMVSPLRVVWEGPQRIHFGMAVVNRELCRELRRFDDIELSTVGSVVVRHQWPPNFEPPADDSVWVTMQPWELGSIPRAWVDPIETLVDELWVPSHYVRQCFLRSGIDPSRIVVMPLGVDVDRFTPSALPATISTRKRFRFLFVGGTIPRKGVDILLDTYLNTFTPADDVCLLVKDLGADSFYKGQGLRDQITAVAKDDRYAEVHYLDEDISDDLLPSLYTACHCLVHPYRGEGFGLPILEAMACGLPVVVPGYGPALEVCDPQAAYIVPANEVVLREKRIRALETVDFPSYCEVDRAALALTLRQIAGNRQEARARGLRARERAMAHTWTLSADRIHKQLRVLAAQRPRRLAPAPPPRPRRLSVCMVVRNEEPRIAGAIGGVRPVADELIVIDTGSTDRTVEIARELGADVSSAPWTNDWAAARNAAIGRATGDWIFFIDADQKLDEGSRGEIRRIIQHDQPMGFLVRQLNYTQDTTPAKAIEHLTVRLFRRHEAIRYAGAIHEQVVSLDAEVALTLEACGVVLHHYGYETSETRRRKALRDIPMLEAAATADPANPFHPYNLGIAYHTLEQDADAERALRRSIALAAETGSAPGFVMTAYVILAGILVNDDRAAEGAGWCRALLARAPAMADAWCTLGACELRLGNAAGAADAYRAALGCAPQPRTSVIDRAASGWKAWSGLGRAELLLGRVDAAIVCLQKALTLNPADVSALDALAGVFRAMGATKEADEAAEAARLWRAGAQPQKTIQLNGRSDDVLPVK